MKYLIATSALIMLSFSCVKRDRHFDDSYYNCSLSFADSSSRNIHDPERRALLKEMTQSGVPGIMMAMREPSQGLWVGSAGFADLRNHSPMRNCNITRVGSTVKTFTAVTILKLREEGKLSLDDPINRYLSDNMLRNIENSKLVTIRNLLQHSSGIYNYIQNPAFRTASLNNLIKEWKPEELLSYARGKKAYFQPGRDVKYSNTNYVFLGMIIEEITGKPFYIAFQHYIFSPLHLEMTRFAATAKVPEGIVRGYVDMYNQLKVIDATYFSGWDYFTADGGLISNPVDMSLFMEALFTGRLLSPQSLQEMLHFKTPKAQSGENVPIHYGLGIFKIETPFGDAYNHSGDAIGYYATMMYFPNRRIALSWAVNGNYGKIDELTSSRRAIMRILDVIL